jgi:hypothetical protein
MKATFLLAALALAAPSPIPPPPSPPGTVVLPAEVRRHMNDLFLRNNQHWDELGEMNTLEQMLGTTGPTQREYLGCLVGHAVRDTLWVDGWREARDLKQLQFGVGGSCEHVGRSVGTWHTHPFRADLKGNAVKERRLSEIDLATFGSGRDLVTLVIWDVDSLDAAIRGANGRVVHPAALILR